jgi:phosphoserine phosphatase RsbU/P
MRILIAEDDLASRMILSATLRKIGYDVVETQNGEQALDAMTQPGAPSLAILDWMMPGLDGSEVIRILRDRPSSTPPYLVLLTARTDKQDVAAGLNCGANDYLTKPFDPGELRARIAVGQRMIELQDSLHAKIAELRQALEEVKTLRGILPICSCCKKIRNDTGYWLQVEEYIGARSDAQFTHGICPQCLENLYPEFNEDESKDAPPPAESPPPVS